MKQRLQAGKLTLGSFLTFDFWPGYLEILKSEGMHFAVLDLEHGAATLNQAEELCRVARLLDFPLLLRPEAVVFHLMRKYLDMGPAGFMLPWVESEDQLQTARDAMFTPPRGKRGPGGSSIFHNRSLNKEGWDEVEQHLFLMPQIETLAGVTNAEALAASGSVDALMLGPYDLSLNMGLCWQSDHPDLIGAIDSVRQRAANAGKPCGMVVGTAEQGQFWIRRGFHLLICSEISAMVRQHVRLLVQETQAAAPKEQA